MDQREKKAWGTCRVAFMANMKLIQERMDTGQPLAHIHRELKNSLDDMPYARFTYYIRKHITQAKRKTSVSISPEPGIKKSTPRAEIDTTPRFIPPDTAPDMSNYV